MPSQSGTSSSARNPRSPRTGDSPRCRGRRRATNTSTSSTSGASTQVRSSADPSPVAPAARVHDVRRTHRRPGSQAVTLLPVPDRPSVVHLAAEVADRFAGEARQPGVRSAAPACHGTRRPRSRRRSARAPASPARPAGGGPRRARTRAAPAAGARRRTARARAPSWQDELADLVGVGGDLPAEAVGVGEVAGVAAPVAVLALARLGAERRRQREDLVDLGLGGARCATA